MSTPFLGEIRMFGFNFAPIGWALCDGQLLAINQNTALFSLLGTFYGGDGQTTFALPDLQGRAPKSMGNGAGLSAYSVGQKGGVETVTLSVSQLPSHAHGVEASATKAKLKTPAGAVPALTKADAYDAAPDGVTTMNAGMIAATGGGEPVTNLPPFLVVNFCIALTGIFPSRN